MTITDRQCPVHPLYARTGCIACIADHKAGEHHGAPSPHCKACRTLQRLAEINHARTPDARRRQAHDL